MVTVAEAGESAWNEVFGAAVNTLGVGTVVAMVLVLAAMGMFAWVTVRFLRTVDGFSGQLTDLRGVLQHHSTHFQEMLRSQSVETEVLRGLGEEVKGLAQAVRDNDRSVSQAVLTIVQTLRPSMEAGNLKRKKRR